VSGVGCCGVHPSAVGESPGPVTATGGEPSRADHRSLGYSDHELAPLGSDERTDGGIEQSDQEWGLSLIANTNYRIRELQYAGKPDWTILAAITPPQFPKCPFSRGSDSHILIASATEAPNAGTLLQFPSLSMRPFPFPAFVTF